MKTKPTLKALRWLLLAAGLIVCQTSHAQINYTANAIGGVNASVAAGELNENWCANSIIASGRTNYIDALYMGALSEANIIGGGLQNAIYGQTCFIGGGQSNLIENSAVAVISGGWLNSIYDCTNLIGPVIGGGYSNMIASADGSTIAGGAGNVIGSNTNISFGTIGGGDLNFVTADFSTIPGGYAGKTTLYGQYAHANAAFWTLGQGEAQACEYVLSHITTSSNFTQLFLNGDSTALSGWDRKLVVPPNTSWAFDIMVASRNSTGSSAIFRTNAVVKNVGGTISINNGAGQRFVPIIFSEAPGWRVKLVPNSSDQSMEVWASGDNGTNRWVARVHTSEVTY